MEVAHGRSPESIDQGDVDVAALEGDPGFVERPGSVHLDMGLSNRRPGAQAIDGHGEREGQDAFLLNQSHIA